MYILVYIMSIIVNNTIVKFKEIYILYRKIKFITVDSISHDIYLLYIESKKLKSQKKNNPFPDGIDFSKYKSCM